MNMSSMSTDDTDVDHVWDLVFVSLNVPVFQVGHAGFEQFAYFGMISHRTRGLVDSDAGNYIPHRS